MKFWRKKAEAEPHWTENLPPGFLEEGDRLAASAWAALGMTPAHASAALASSIKQAADYQGYLVSAQACGVSVEHAKAVFEEELAKPGDFDSWLRAAKERIYSGEECAS